MPTKLVGPIIKRLMGGMPDVTVTLIEPLSSVPSVPGAPPASSKSRQASFLSESTTTGD